MKLREVQGLWCVLYWDIICSYKIVDKQAANFSVIDVVEQFGP
jgi:hypothetical protein